MFLEHCCALSALLLFVVFSARNTYAELNRDVGVKSEKCEPISIPLCTGLSYNKTIFPNLLNHTKQIETLLPSVKFVSLVATQCHPDVQFFVCSVFAPVCTASPHPRPPCRPVCERVREACEEVMKEFDMEWPAYLSCSTFPPRGLCLRPPPRVTKPEVRVTPGYGKEDSTTPGDDDPCPTRILGILVYWMRRLIQFPDTRTDCFPDTNTPKL